MIGRTYLERGQPVVVLVRWRHNLFGRLLEMVAWRLLPLRDGPRNVPIERADGERVVRPFRGLRKIPQTGDWTDAP